MIAQRQNFKALALAVLFSALLASPLAAAPLGAQEGIWLARINQTLKAMPPMSGRFEQKLPNGGHAAGSYAIDWPSRLRFAYDGGGGIVVV